MRSSRDQAVDKVEMLLENGATPISILDHLVSNYLSGFEALQAITSAERELLGYDEEDEDEDEEEMDEDADWEEE